MGNSPKPSAINPPNIRAYMWLNTALTANGYSRDACLKYKMITFQPGNTCIIHMQSNGTWFTRVLFFKSSTSVLFMYPCEPSTNLRHGGSSDFSMSEKYDQHNNYRHKTYFDFMPLIIKTEIRNRGIFFFNIYNICLVHRV